MSFARILLFHILSFAVFVTAYSTPGPCSGVCGNSHDPALIRRASDGKWFRFSTGNRINIASAPDVSGPWTAKGSAIKGGSVIKKAGNQDLWAPDVSFINGTYYLLYTVSHFGSQDSEIGYATSKDLESWSDKGTTGVSSAKGTPYNAIDGNLIASDNRHYMAFGSFWQDLYVAPLELPPKKSGRDRQIAFQPAGGHEMEAAYILPHQGMNYLFYSAGKCCGLDKNRPAKGQEYRIMVCRSKSVTGPYTDKVGRDCKQGGGTVVLPSHDWVYAPGGQGVYEDEEAGVILYYHYVDTRIGYSDGQKKFGWNKVRFEDGWPVV